VNSPSHYTVVQYLPNPLSGERLNVGLIAWGGGRIAARFIEDWRRVHNFGGEDIEFIRDFARRVEEATDDQSTLAGLGDARRFDEEHLRKIVGTWMHSIQLSEPRTSLKTPTELLDELVPVFLRSVHRRAGKKLRDRRSAAAMVAHSLWACVTQVTGKAPQDLFKRNHAIKGKLDQHAFDAVIANGRPLFAAHGLSFEIAETRILGLEVDATAFAITDVRAAHPKFPLAVLTLPPIRKSTLFDKAQKVFGGLDAEVVESQEKMDKWATKTAKKTLVDVS